MKLTMLVLYMYYYVEVAIAYINKPALDEEVAEQLWVKSKEWTGVQSQL